MRRQMLYCDAPRCAVTRIWDGMEEAERAGWFFTKTEDLCPWHGGDIRLSDRETPQP